MTDVLVVGGGLAAMAAALEATEAGGSVVLASAGTGSSPLAQGGIAVAIGSDDSPELHEADTLSAGVGLCDPEAVGMLATEAPHAMAWLEARGVEFDRGSDGLRALALEAAHSRSRVLHAGGDGTGATIMSALRSHIGAACRSGRLQQLDDAWLDGLLSTGDRVTGGRFRSGDRLIEVTSRATVLATGGYAGLFARSTTSANCQGAGLIVALDAGAQLADLEFVQFHPTAFAGPNDAFLVTEALRGAGGHLLDAQGRRFLFDVDPRGELAPRATVARSIARHLRRTGESSVFLDAAPIGQDALRECFPGFMARCRRVGIDPLRERVPVSPAAHYTMGGIVTDLRSQTGVEGLLAAGECARTGLHGANRLASNSLLEAIVFGRMAGRSALVVPTSRCEAVRATGADTFSGGLLQLAEVRGMLEASAGPLRSGPVMSDGLARLTADRGADAKTEAARRLACLVVGSALARLESRGAHTRDDYPDQSPIWRALEVGVRRGAHQGLEVAVRPRAALHPADAVAAVAD